ncbi:MAG: hypothetical protein GPI99_20540 [Microcystis aeruginosa W13-15]|nr:hypothetical protein [Microcystis aeruginosa W13-16]NCQ75134.1 hypothetical protein [Microcystis aeruginosa W13-13]NCQ80379.1 hypothetical protein [Microcystis aeruginosa W13-15]NCR19505.1 hypothetical protein [Microcystis aeruginosa LL13-03]NCR45372.1 hypothetical protein [Microcystis aeruginosa SX13-01]NCR68776.1 hypothetical protein [Microcystis aeruginosa LL11-07]NCR91280.1 hypothetical protein [Microcystis aeruginosa G13-10]NCS16647.1 hypothetical protein [Microcystis aeruginosa G13-
MAFETAITLTAESAIAPWDGKAVRSFWESQFFGNGDHEAKMSAIAVIFLIKL